MAATGSSVVLADEHYYGGVTVDIDREVLGYLFVEDATVNLLDGAHIKNDVYLGDVYIASGAIVNIYGGEIDNVLMISTMYNGLPDPVVTVYGADFAVDGAAVDPSVTELFLQGQTLSGTYENGTPLAFTVECFREGNVMMTLRLAWVDAAPLPVADIEAADIDFGEVAVGDFALAAASIANAGDAALTVTSIVLEDASAQFFISGAALPAVVAPGEAMQVWLAYIPAVEEAASGVLRIGSNDPDEGMIEIALTGTGIEKTVVEEPEPLTPLEQMDQLLAYFDASVEDGTIEGLGRGNSAKNKLSALRSLLETARYLIEQGHDAAAAVTLHAAEMKTDGESKPADFVTGEGVGELNRQIREMMAVLKGA